MNDSITNRPIVKTTTVQTKTVEMVLTIEEVNAILKRYICKNFAEFRNMPLCFEYHLDDGEVYQVEVNATSVLEK